MTDQDVRRRIYEEQRNQIEQDMAPFGFIDDGLGDDTFVDGDGSFWYGNKEETVDYMIPDLWRRKRNAKNGNVQNIKEKNVTAVEYYDGSW